MLIYFANLYKEERSDGSNSSVKWSAPNIHDLMNIFKKIEVDKILDPVFDKQLSLPEELSVVQLREECASLNLSRKGIKVRSN